MSQNKNLRQGSKTKSSKDTSFRKIVIEVVSIVLGVLLALAVNEWRENRANHAEAESALQNIKNEILSNQSHLSLIHEINLKTTQAMVEDPSSADESKFIPGMQLKSAAWETMLSTGVSNHVDYQIILILSNLYSIQDLYKDTGRMLTESAMNMSAYAAALGSEVDDNQFAKNFSDYMNMLVQVEDQLLNSYESALTHLQ